MNCYRARYYCILLYLNSAFGAKLPSFCAKTHVTTGHVIRSSANIDTTLNDDVIEYSTDFRFDVGFRETICFQVEFEQNKSKISNEKKTINQTLKQAPTYRLLYTFEFRNLVQIHPIRYQYIFGIPQLQSTCLCDCPGGENFCQVDQRYKNCSSLKPPDSSAYYCTTTFHAHQSAKGCSFGSEAEMCCQVKVTPFKNAKFEAVQIGQPETSAQIVLKIFQILPDDDWMMEDERMLQVNYF